MYMRRSFKFLFFVAVLITIMIFIMVFKYICFISTIDVESIDRLEDTLRSYDINKLDLCLSQDAEICYNNKVYKYSDCRNNILENMTKKNYTISMYGGGNNIFDNNIQKINTQVYGSVLNKDYGENSFTVYLKRIDFDEFKIVKIESNDEILKQIFLKIN